MNREQPKMTDSFLEGKESEGYTDKLTKKEMDKVDPVSGLTWRELVYGVSKETLKDTAKGKEPEEKKKNLYERLFPEKKEKKEVSSEDVLKIIQSYHEVVMKVSAFLDPIAQEYFPNLSTDIAKAQMELVAIQTLMRSQDPATLEAVKKVLKKEENYIDIGEKRHNLYEILFPKKNEKTESLLNENLTKIAISPNIAIVSKAPEVISFLEKNGKTDTVSDELSAKTSDFSQNEKLTVKNSLETVRDYFDMQAKMYGMFGTEIRKYFPKIGERVEENRRAILSIENCLHLNDKTSLKAVQKILKYEEKYIKENKETPLAKLFLQIKPQVEMIFKE